jgi:RimJ/RimL family protein N-acetyltransferase
MSHFFAPDRYASSDFLLRSYQPGDGALLAESVNASYEHLRTFMIWATNNQTLEESEGRVRRFCGNYLLNHDFVLGIFALDGSQLLGGTGYHLRGAALDENTAEIGMWIRGSAAGSGLGTRALLAMLAWGFTEWPWVRLVWKCDTRNLASARVAEKAGMRLEGTFRQDAALPDGTRRDTHSFAMLREEYLANQRS